MRQHAGMRVLLALAVLAALQASTARSSLACGSRAAGLLFVNGSAWAGPADSSGRGAGSRWADSSGGSGSGTARHLAASAICPPGCTTGYCVAASTAAGLRCQLCQGSLIVNKISGMCSCPAGKYSDGSKACRDCSKGSYCEGGDWSPEQPPKQTQCPENMTTLGLRSTSSKFCVNMPGYSYNLDSITNIPSATLCLANTYSPGLKKQRACVPCPTGFTTNGLVARTTPLACSVPAGFYLKSPGQVAPCPRGEWKSGTGTNASCTKCALGATTKLEASTSANNCTDVLAGWYAFNVSGTGIVLEARVCPQKFYCAGGTPAGAWEDPGNATAIPLGDTTVKACPSGTWTQDYGASTPDECLTPPGFYTANGQTLQCTGGVNGGWRADWLPAGQATACKSCGDNVYADRSDLVTVYDPVTYAATTLPVTTDSSDCYIQPGQGMYYSTITGVWRARDCNRDNYGVANYTYGLAPAACKDCPYGMYASANVSESPNSALYYTTNADGSGGFISVKACVTVGGYGYDGRIAQPCGKGWWNPADTWATCTECGYGLTTQDMGAGLSESDCGVAAGFGALNVSGVLAITPCPIGTYNSADWSLDRTIACTPCPNATTTEGEGSDAITQCSLCIAGMGGPLCQTQCGGLGAAATYGPPKRAVNASCLACTPQTTGYAFEYNKTIDLFSAPSVSRAGAAAAFDCLAQFTQINDGAWYLPLADDTATTLAAGVANFSDCVALCSADADCQMLTFNYRTQDCRWRLTTAWSGSGATIAFKAAPAGDTAASPWSAAASAGGRLPPTQPLQQQQQQQQAQAQQAQAQRLQPRGGGGGGGSLARAKALPSGLYTWWQDANAAKVGALQVSPPGAANFTRVQNCLDACDDDGMCAGVLWPSTNAVAADVPKDCLLVYGNLTFGLPQRSVTRADVTRLSRPTDWGGGINPP